MTTGISFSSKCGAAIFDKNLIIPNEEGDVVKMNDGFYTMDTRKRFNPCYVTNCNITKNGYNIDAVEVVQVANLGSIIHFYDGILYLADHEFTKNGNDVFMRVNNVESQVYLFQASKEYVLVDKKGNITRPNLYKCKFELKPDEKFANYCSRNTTKIYPVPDGYLFEIDDSDESKFKFHELIVVPNGWITIIMFYLFAISFVSFMLGTLYK
jgi:hypothetical protein